ncbi:MAG TPA: two-component system sensor histidine kinase/response regulator, partial [Afipia sp.]
PQSTGMGQRIVSAMAIKLETKAERDPTHPGTRIILRLKNATHPPVRQAAVGVA